MKNIILLLISLLFLFPGIANSQNQDRIDSLNNQLSAELVDTSKILLIIKIGNEYDEYDYGKAKQYYNSALSKSLKLKYNKGIALANNGIGMVENYEGNFNKAKFYLHKTLSISIEHRIESGILAAYDNLGIVCLNIGETDSAMLYRKKSIEIYKKNGDLIKVSDGYLWLGTISRNMSNNADAIKYYLKANEVAEKFGDNERVAYALLNMAVVYKNQKNYTKAIEYNLIGLEKLIPLNKLYPIATVYYNMANTYVLDAKYDSAINNYNKALKIRVAIKDSAGIADVYNGIANIYVATSDFKKAKNSFNLALEIAERCNYKYLQGLILINLGDVFFQENDILTSIKYFEEGLIILNEAKNKHAIKTCYNSLMLAYEKSENYKNAYKYSRLLSAMNDSIALQTYSTELSNLQALYDVELKDKTISEQKLNILTLEKTKAVNRLIAVSIILIMAGIIVTLIIRKIKNEIDEVKTRELLIVNEQSKTKEKIADQLHGVSNSLIASSKKLNSLKANNFLNLEAEELLDGVCDDIEHVRKFTRTLSHNIKNKLFWEKGLLRGLEEYFIELNTIEGTKFIFQNAEMSINLEPEASVDIYEIVMELVANSLKHGQEIYQIFLYFRLEDGLLHISYEDDGIGFNTDQIFTSKSIGWKLIADKVENKYGGKIVLESTPLVPGNRVDINIPVKKITN